MTRPRNGGDPTRPGATLRWRQGARAPGEERAADLFLRLPDPPPLDGIARARIASALDESLRAAAPIGRARTVAARGALAGAAVALAVVAFAWATGSGRHLALRGSLDSVAPQGTHDIDLLDGAIARVDAEGVVHVERGRVLVRSADAPRRLVTPGFRLELQPRSRVEVDASSERVACAAGSAALVWLGSDEVYHLTAGAEVSRASTHALAPPTPAEPEQPPTAPSLAASPRAEAAPPARAASAPHRKSEGAPSPAAAAPASAAPGAPAATAREIAIEDPSGPDRDVHEAFRALRRDHDAARALGLLEGYLGRFPDGALAPEARTARIEALAALGRDTAALTVLDAAPLDGTGAGAGSDRAQRALRSELRARAGRCQDATADALALVGTADAPLDGAAERALRVQAFCRVRAGDPEGARAARAEYLKRFPKGRFADEMRRQGATDSAPPPPGNTE